MSLVLIVEDSQPLISLLTKKIILAGLDCEFILQTGALTRTEVAEQIIDKDPDILILDLNMPNAGGIAVLEELRYKEKELQREEIPVIILTAMDADQQEIEYLKKKASLVEFAHKPITNMPAFIELVQQTVSKK